MEYPSSNLPSHLWRLDQIKDKQVDILVKIRYFQSIFSSENMGNYRKKQSLLTDHFFY